jgi:hypothetical protein
MRAFSQELTTRNVDEIDRGPGSNYQRFKEAEIWLEESSRELTKDLKEVAMPPPDFTMMEDESSDDSDVESRAGARAPPPGGRGDLPDPQPTAP